MENLSVCKALPLFISRFRIGTLFGYVVFFILFELIYVQLTVMRTVMEWKTLLCFLESRIQCYSRPDQAFLYTNAYHRRLTLGETMGGLYLVNSMNKTATCVRIIVNFITNGRRLIKRLTLQYCDFRYRVAITRRCTLQRTALLQCSFSSGVMIYEQNVH